MLEALLTPQELADLLGVPKQTVYKWNHEGTGPPPISCGRHLRYRPSDVARWLEENSTRPPRPAA